jgi:hypothetical protein
MVQIESIKRLKEHAPRVDHPKEPFEWFRSKENQVTFRKDLRILTELDYQPTPEEVGEQRRETTGSRALTLFLIKGDSVSLDHLQSRIQLREHDIIERYGQEEVRGVLAHLREVDPLVVEKKFQQFMESHGLVKLKCVFLQIHSPKDLEADLPELIKTTLQEMSEGELRTLSI